MASRTVYEFLAEAATTYKGGGGVPFAQVYYDCARLIALFTIADLRHDFGYELNAKSGDKTLGEWLCAVICAAFYTQDNTKYAQLLGEISQIYVNDITSDTTAKSVMKREFNAFYDNVIVPNRAIWGPNYYAARYDDSGSLPLLYTDAFHATITHKKITEGSGKDTVIVVDALYGNPVDHIFSSKKGTDDQSHYIYNYSSALDAASKPIGTIHGYMHTYIQKDIATKIIPAAYTGFGAPVRINNFRYQPVAPGHSSSTWKTSVTVVDIAPRPIDRTFSPYEEASVDKLALVPVRSGATKADIDTAIAGLRDFNISEAIANHIFKSLGDRLQTYTMRNDLTNYTKNGDIRLNNASGDPPLNFHGKHTIQFTNDILASMNNYLMQVNTVFTGLHKVIYYAYVPRKPLTRDKVKEFFVERAASIHEIMNIIKEKNKVNINRPISIFNTLYNAIAARDALVYCQMHFLFKNFIEETPKDEKIDSIITTANFQSFVPLMTENLKDGIIEKNVPADITQDELSRNVFAMQNNASILNENIKGRTGSLVSDDAKFNIYVEYAAIANSLTNILILLGITSNTDILSNCILFSMNYKSINDLVFDMNKLFVTLTNVTGDRTSPLIQLSNTYGLPDGQKPVLMTLFTTLSRSLRENAIRDLDAVNSAISSLNNTAIIFFNSLDNPFKLNMMEATKVAIIYFKMAIYIKLINSAQTKPLIVSILASNKLDYYDNPDKKVSTKKTVSIKQLARPVTFSKKSAQPKSIKNRLLIKIKATIIGGDTRYTAIQQAEAVNIITNYLAGQHGGSRSRKRHTMEELCMLKLEFMFDVINNPNNRYALNTLLYLANVLIAIIEDYKALKGSSSKPHLLQSSVLRSLSMIREDENKGSQEGGSRSKKQSTLVLVQSRGSPSVEWLPERPGSRVMVMRSTRKASPRTKKASPHTRKASPPKFPGTGRRLGGSPVEVISRKEGISRIEKQLISFFWLGVNRHPEQLMLEEGMYSELLPIEGLVAVGNIINQIFWQPFFMYNKKSYESIVQLFDTKYLPSLKEILSAPKPSRRSSTRKRSKSSSA